METKEDLILKINKITTSIHENYPALINLINEMPQTIPIEKTPKSNVEALKKITLICSLFFRNYISEQQLKKL